MFVKKDKINIPITFLKSSFFSRYKKAMSGFYILNSELKKNEIHNICFRFLLLNVFLDCKPNIEI